MEVELVADGAEDEAERILTGNGTDFERTENGFIIRGERKALFDVCLKLYTGLDYNSFVAKEVGGKVLMCG